MDGAGFDAVVVKLFSLFIFLNSKGKFLVLYFTIVQASSALPVMLHDWEMKLQ